MSKSINNVMQRAIDLAGGTQVALARKAGISQNAVWKLLTGATRHPSYKTSVLLEIAVDKKISRAEFMDSELCKTMPVQTKLEINVKNEPERLTL